jgi:hypothetical protein
VITPFVNDKGEIAGVFPEQTPYLEWQNSSYAAASIQCQDCHMPRVNEPVQITYRPPSMETHSPFWRHIFVGGNTFMQQIFRDYGADIGVTAVESHFGNTLEKTREQLQERTANILPTTSVQGDQLTLNVNIDNLTGHKFPTGFPSRRAWLHVRVTNDGGQTMFESGAIDADGRIKGLDPEFEPHRDVIASQNQVQIYESVMADVNGARTYTLLRGASYLKDNRIPPKGFVTNVARYADIAIRGHAEADPNFNRAGSSEGTGRDTVTYLIDTSNQTGRLNVLVELLYQTASPNFVDDLLRHDTSSVTRFAGYYNDAEKNPLVIQSASVAVLK